MKRIKDSTITNFFVKRRGEESTETPSQTPTSTQAPTPTLTPTHTQILTPTQAPILTLSPTPTPLTPTPTPTPTPSLTQTPTPTQAPTHTQIPTPTQAPIITPSPTHTLPTPTSTPTPTLTPTLTLTLTPTETLILTPIPAPTQNATLTHASQYYSSPSVNTTYVQEGDTKTLLERLSDSDITSLEHDPGLRRTMFNFHVDDREIVRCEYIRRGLCQPRDHTFPFINFGKTKRRFVPNWFDKFMPWLEYSKSKDAAFCFPCYLFKNNNAYCGGDAFVYGGFNTWCKGDAFQKHVSGHLSAHNNALKSLMDFKNEKSSIISSFKRKTSKDESDYDTRLEAHIEVVRFLLFQGLAFRGHDESKKSLNKGNYLQLLKVIAKRDANEGKVMLENAPKNFQLTSHKIQKDLANACARETTKKIIEELDGDFLAILADKSADIADKEQLSLCLRYVDKKGMVKERLLGLVHAGNTTSLTLKATIESLLMKHSLTLSRVRGQGYDGASNMQGAISGLRTLILNESPCAYYIHCCAHKLQLTLVVVATKNDNCAWLFETLATLLNLVGGSCKHKEIIRERQAEYVLEALDSGEIESGTGLNQELSLSRPGATRWSSHFKTILGVFHLYPTILDVLDFIGEASTSTKKVKVESIAFPLRRFDFVFGAQLMLTIFGITNQLNLALQRKEQDIVNVMALVDVTKKQLQNFRDKGWDSHLEEVTSFCAKYDIGVPKMDDMYVLPGRYRRGQVQETNNHHFRVGVFRNLIDQIFLELDDRFDEVSKELLICMSCFHPENQFAAFDSKKLLQLAQCYPNEFSSIDLLYFEYQLENFIYDVRSDERFWGVKILNELSMKLIELKKHLTDAKVYLLLKLVLTLPVATTSIERAFSAMTYIKNKLRNSMSDGFLNDNLVTYVKRDLFEAVSDKDITRQFQNMKHRRSDNK